MRDDRTCARCQVTFHGEIFCPKCGAPLPSGEPGPSRRLLFALLVGFTLFGAGAFALHRCTAKFAGCALR